MRDDLIPGIVLLLQKQWRGTLCRQRYRKMKALMTIMQYYRRYKIRTYVTQLSQTFKYLICCSSESRLHLNPQGVLKTAFN